MLNQLPIQTFFGFDYTSENLELLHSQKRKLDHKTHRAPEKQTTAKYGLSMGGLVSLHTNVVQMWTPRAFLHAELTAIKRSI